MKCTKVEAIIVDLVRGQLADSRLRDETLAHLEQCISCAARLSAQRLVEAGVHAVVKSIREHGASARVEVALRKAMRDRVSASTTPSGRKFSGFPRWAMAAAAIATLLFGVLLIGVIRRSTSGNNQEQLVKTPHPTNGASDSNREHQTIETSPATTKSEKDSVLDKSASQASAVSRKQTRRRARAPLVDKESTTDFYLLADEGEHVPLESGQVVRVRLPLSSLVPSELAEGPDADDKLITADVVIGQDGLARAVRFVR